MKKFACFILLVVSSFSFSDTTTSRAGITIPDLFSSGWAPKLQADLAIIDSSMCIQGVANTFTSTNTFNKPIVLGNQWLRFNDASTHYIQFNASATATTTSFILPANDGSNGQVLTTDGSGNLSFAVVGASDIASGSTNYIQNTTSLQSGSSFYVVSGSVSLRLNSYQVTIGTGNASPLAALDISAQENTAGIKMIATALGDKTTSSGLAAKSILTVTGAAGQSSSFAGTSTSGGTGGGATITGGAGGAITDSAGTGALHAAGGGGSITLAPGAGGNASVGSGKGGAGGSTVIQSGQGGTSAGAAGGIGGSTSLSSNSGGVSSAASASGAGGTFTILGGNGGANSTASGTGGNGALVRLTAGDGGAGSGGATAGNGGNIALNAGHGGAGGGVDGSVVVGNVFASTMTIYSKVGISTGAPQAQLDVNGTSIFDSTAILPGATFYITGMIQVSSVTIASATIVALTAPGTIAQYISSCTIVSSVTTSSTFTGVGPTATITPTSISSVMEVCVMGDFYNSALQTINAYMTLERNSTDLALPGTNGFLQFGGASAIIGSLVVPVGFCKKDSPATSSATTYRAFARNSNNSTAINFPLNSVACVEVKEIRQ